MKSSGIDDSKTDSLSISSRKTMECDHTAGFHSLSSTSEKICIDCKEVMPGKDDAKLTTHKRKSGVGPGA